MCSTSDEKQVCSESQLSVRKRRSKRDRAGCYNLPPSLSSSRPITTKKPKKKSRARQKHEKNQGGGGLEALIPSLIGLTALVFVILGQMGFRGRATTAGIDLGTTNSVVCVQAPSKGVGKITCIPDPLTNSSIIPSVVSFLEPHERQRSKKAKQHEKFKLSPPPSHVVVGQIAKHRIDSHPHQTLYHAKRLLGRSGDDGAIESMRHEVEFGISVAEASGGEEESNQVVMQVMHDHDILSISPHHVGSYVVNYLMDMTRAYLGHDNVQSAVICVPAKFDARQRQETVKAFSDAGITVTRILEEPSAAALAYGLHKKEGVEYILVYDFGGGTLDVSLLHVTEGFADVMGSDGDELLGGADFDAAVASLLHGKIEDSVDHTNNALKGLHATLGDEFEDELLAACPIVDKTPLCTLSSLHTTGEKLKIELSFFPEGDVRVESSCFAVRHDVVPSSVSDLCSSLVPIQLTLTTTEFDKVSQFLYDRAVLPVLRLLKELDLEPNNVDEVVMVGGTTRMPQIQRLVGAVFSDDTTINTHIDPDITVAYGAASIID